MMDFVKAHYGKLVAFLAGWVAEFSVGMSAYLESALVGLGIK